MLRGSASKSVVIGIASNRQRFEKPVEFCENLHFGNIVRKTDCVGLTVHLQWVRGIYRLSAPQTLRKTPARWLPAKSLASAGAWPSMPRCRTSGQSVSGKVTRRKRKQVAAKQRFGTERLDRRLRLWPWHAVGQGKTEGFGEYQAMALRQAARHRFRVRETAVARSPAVASALPVETHSCGKASHSVNHAAPSRCWR